jgi:2-oxo-4-hydroxy-4-carboxy-5-ureidoimidazoline decarboxylase
MMLDDFNQASDDELLRSALRECCAAELWVNRIIAGRPYPDEAALLSASDVATTELDNSGLDDALAGHPRIGERAAAGHGAWSRQEHSGVAGAGADLRAELAAANAAYEQRFGHVYLVCATGKSAEEMLVICRSRLTNDPDTEHDVVRTELASINRLRLGKLLHPEGER